MSFITGSGLTRFGRHDGKGTLDLMSEATDLALADAGLVRADIDGLVCGYSTTLPHLMLSTVFARSWRYRLRVYCGACGGTRRRSLAR